MNSGEYWAIRIYKIQNITRLIAANLTEIKLFKISPDWLPTDNHWSGERYCQPDRNEIMQNITRLNWQLFTNLVYSIWFSNRFGEVRNITRIVFSPEWSINHQNDSAFTHLSKLVNITRLSILLWQTTYKGEYHQNDPTDFH